MAKQSNPNARRALEEMKMEIADELNSKLTYAGQVGGTMTKRLVEMGERQLLKGKKADEISKPNQ